MKMDNPRNSSSHPSDYNLEGYRTHVGLSMKKHTMVLNLENKSSNPFGADQTPTPTRFIRNCEEVGLFQDLQNVNPFEETFRKAVESGKTGSSALQNCRLTAVTDDTLHTPHVFPHIIENESLLRLEIQQSTRHVDLTGGGGCRERGEGGVEGQEFLSGVESAQRSGSVVKVVRQEADTSQLRSITASLPQRSQSRDRDSMVPVSAANAVPLILQMPDGRLMQVNATPIDMNRTSELQGPIDLVARSKSEMTSVILHTPQPAPVAPQSTPPTQPVAPATSSVPVKKPDTDNISPFIKEKLKARLGNVVASHSNTQNVANQMSGNLGQKERAQNMRSSLSNASNSDDDEETKRQKFLERNRAAAQRCRQKRKFWVEQLERRADWMMADNHQLQLEVTSLRAEVARLKTLLLAHKDCPITRAVWNNESSLTHQAIFPLNLDQVAPVHIIKPLSQEESHFRKNLKKKLRTAQKPSSLRPVNQVQENSAPPEPKANPEITYLPKKKRLSLNIESAKQSSCFLDEKNNSPLVKNDKFLTSTVLTTEPSELESLNKPVATQVITLNPNVLFRDNHLRGTSPPLLAISPQAPVMDYT